MGVQKLYGPGFHDFYRVCYNLDHQKEDHDEREFKYLIIGRILDLLKKSSKTREAPYKWSTTLSILDLKIFSEVIVPSKRDPPARIEKHAMS